MSVDILQIHNNSTAGSRVSTGHRQIDYAATVNQDDSRYYDDEALVNVTEPDASILQEEIAAQGLSNLNWSADGTCQVFLNLSLPNCQLRDISLLQTFIHLQTVSLPHNEIEDLSALGGMSTLLELDVSHNRISRMLDFTPPKNLKVVNMSFNLVSEIPDLSVHHYLQYLDLGYNNIAEIHGLSECRRLQYLSLKHNRISRIQGLDNLPLKFLSLSCNQLTKIENLDTLELLQTVELAANKLQTMEGFHHHKFLESLDLEENRIVDMADVSRASSLSLLRNLNLRGNPVCELPDYRLAVVFNVHQLTELDGVQVTVEEKVAAKNLFEPALEYLAARDHMMHVVYAFLQPHRLLDITLPMLETPYPILVLVGPQGIGKKSLAQKLVEELPDYFGYAPSHTTRQPYADEAQAKDYNFVSLDDFETGIKMGAFLQTCSYDAELYGLSLEAVEAVARESLACVVHMELEGVLTLKNSYLEPRYVLLLPLTRDAHERRLIEKGVYSDLQVKAILDRAETYAEYNREHPGFFDTTISCDDISVMYCRLRKLVLEYLGIVTPPAKEHSDLETSGTELSIDYCGGGGGEQTAGGTGGSGMECLDLFRLSKSAPATGRDGARHAWSRPSLVDCTAGDRATATTKSDTRPGSRTTPQAPRGIVEEESFRRRQSAAKGSITGATPALFEQLLQRAPKGAVDSFQSSADCSSAACRQQNEKRWYSAPPSKPEAGYFGAPPLARTGVDDGDDYCASECGGGGEDGGPVGGDAMHPSAVEANDGGDRRQSPDPDPPITPLSRRDSMTDLTSAGSPSRPASSSSRRQQQHKSAAAAPRHFSEPAIVPAASSRPGSSRHAVLPPIPQFYSADAVIVRGTASSPGS